MPGSCGLTERPPRTQKTIDAVIVSTARTGLAKSWKGAFNMTYGATLGGHAVQHAVARAGIDPSEVEDVIMGGTVGKGTTGGNIARAIALRAGLSVTTGGLTINRFCSSGLQSIALAAQRTMTEGCPVMVAGGVESISCVQNEANRLMRVDPWLAEHKPELYWNMLQTAEQVIKRYNIPKLAQDEYGVRSQQRGIQPLGIFRGFAIAGCEPDEMGIGPVFAVPRLLQRAGLKVSDIGLWELNEAFACQVIYSRDKLGIRTNWSTSMAARLRSATPAVSAAHA